MSLTTTPASTAPQHDPPGGAAAGCAAVIDHIGPPRDPYRVTIMRLARRNETYEIRWRENARQEDGTITRERRNEPGGHSKAIAYPQAEKVYRNLVTSSGYHGAPARPNCEPKTPPQPTTLTFVASITGARSPCSLVARRLRNRAEHIKTAFRRHYS